MAVSYLHRMQAAMPSHAVMAHNLISSVPAPAYMNACIYLHACIYTSWYRPGEFWYR